MTNLSQNVQHAYDTVAEDYAKYFPDTRTEAPLDLAMIGEFLSPVMAAPKARVLDAGCGAERMTRYLADKGCPVEGVDLSPGMIAMARRDHPDLRFCVGSLTRLPHQAAAFGGVLLWYSIIHSPPTEQPQIFNEVARVLRPTGRVIVGFQAGEGVQDLSPVYRKFGHEIRLLRHLNTATSVAERMEAAGF